MRDAALPGERERRVSDSIRVGVDLVEVRRIRHAVEQYGPRFVERVYTPGECAHSGNRVPSLAARWAAKEAVAKALGTGIGPVGWREIEVLNDDRGAPYVCLHGSAAQLARDLGLKHWAISLSHTRELAIAFVMASQSSQ